jgi:hypothetical protein
VSWLSLALTLLRIADSLISWMREQGQINQGKDAEIAKASAAILIKTRSAKEIMAQVTAMTDEQVDKTLKGLEP